MKQKLGLACALIHTPKVLLLDEPTGGVDPVSRRDLWRILYDLLREGVTIFVSTAYLDEAERCSRIGLIHKGKLLTTGGPWELRRMLHFPMIEVLTPEARQARAVAESIEGVRSVTVYGDRLHVGLDAADAADAVVAAIASSGIEVVGKRQIMPSLEDAFIALVSGRENDREEQLMRNSGTAVEVHDLSRAFGSFVAVDKISLQVAKGGDLRLPGTQRGGEIDDHKNALRTAHADRRGRDGRRATISAPSRKP